MTDLEIATEFVKGEMAVTSAGDKLFTIEDMINAVLWGKNHFAEARKKTTPKQIVYSLQLDKPISPFGNGALIVWKDMKWIKLVENKGCNISVIPYDLTYLPGFKVGDTLGGEQMGYGITSSVIYIK
jgi:hypothetical protein